MKLAYLANIRLPTEKAHGIQIMNMCASFASQKRRITQTGAQTNTDSAIEVTLIVPRRRNPLNADPFEYYGVERNFSICAIQVLDFLALPFLKKLGFILETASFMTSLLWHLRYDVFDVYYTRDLAIAALISRRIPVFYEVHSFPERPTWLHRRAWKRVKGIIVISDGLRTALIEHGVPENKILLARDAVDMKHFQITESRAECRAALQLPIDKKIAVYTGHLYAWKGANILAQAAEFLYPTSNTGHQTSDITRKPVEVYLVGGTDEDVAAFRARYHAPNLHIVGRRAPREIPLWLKAADVLVLPTSGKEPIGAQYTSPMKLFEYMASGTPIVATDIPSLREVLNESTACLILPDDAMALAEGVVRVLGDEQWARRLASAAQTRVTEYSWENRAKQIEAFIKQRHD